MQDNSPSHQKITIIKQFFDKMEIILIENSWSQLKKKVVLRKLRSEKEMEEVI